jgi:hypothetical protein
VLSPRLNALLHDPTVSQDEAARAIAASAEMAAELASRFADLQAPTAPAGARGVVEVLTPLLAVFTVDEKVTTDAFWDAYVCVLKEKPMCVLRAGVAAYLAAASSEWFPKPGPLLAHCRKVVASELLAAGRARRTMALLGMDARRGGAA